VSDVAVEAGGDELVYGQVKLEGGEFAEDAETVDADVGADEGGSWVDCVWWV
jgi:hypothetical protein